MLSGDGAQDEEICVPRTLNARPDNTTYRCMIRCFFSSRLHRALPNRALTAHGKQKPQKLECFDVVVNAGSIQVAHPQPCHWFPPRGRSYRRKRKELRSRRHQPQNQPGKETKIAKGGERRGRKARVAKEAKVTHQESLLPVVLVTPHGHRARLCLPWWT